MRKIAFCFMIYDVINHEQIWRRFFENVDENKYTIYIHYKSDATLKYFERFKLKNCIPTKYADISLVAAQNVMFAEAMRDSDNKLFILLSNSCIPLKSFDEIYNALDAKFSYFHTWNPIDSFPRSLRTLMYIERKYIQKASQWSIINRKHVHILLTETEYMEWFDFPENVPDEHCYISKLYYNNLQDEIIDSRLLSRAPTTYTNWYRLYNTSEVLHNYNMISNEELQKLLNTESFFGRKFTIECSPYLMTREYIMKIKK